MRYLDRVSLAFPLGAAALAAASGWPASAAIVALSVPAGSPPRACPRCDLADPFSGRVAARARCRRCTVALGPPPLLLAVPMAILAGTAASLVHPFLVACAVCWLTICAIPLAAIDTAARRLPDVLTGTAFAGTAAFLAAAAALDDQWQDLGRACGGALAVACLFTLLALARPGSAGLGDAKLGLSVGALAAWLGWAVLAVAMFGGFLLAGLYGMWLIASRRASLRSTLAFGPFLLAGCLGAVLLASAAGPR